MRWKIALAILPLTGLLYVICTYNSSQYGQHMARNSTTTVIADPTGKQPKNIPIIPVQLSDWQDTRPTYKFNETVTKTDWWKAASFLELEYKKRPVDYSCKNISSRSNYKVCYDGKYKPGKPCLVYSFGIAHDFTFDDEMATKDGCEVHSFDPR
ncbi:uncharacterized protein LOC110456625 isoform X2 [Mizuhopecten yessoensis]|uniref:uncharacterized protein LOC110456625 isoform X2 n=1 Tax=Mizuhopecten yessoensis TaxID=6573 RepID=UPI000B45DDE6|nr:uncharacterized protein LOC110456625 isoform X2 [Mizuhopecten yessoensis]